MVFLTVLLFSLPRRLVVVSFGWRFCGSVGISSPLFCFLTVPVSFRRQFLTLFLLSGVLVPAAVVLLVLCCVFLFDVVSVSVIGFE